MALNVLVAFLVAFFVLTFGCVYQGWHIYYHARKLCLILTFDVMLKVCCCVLVPGEKLHLLDRCATFDKRGDE